jgi:hypothetical protein
MQCVSTSLVATIVDVKMVSLEIPIRFAPLKMMKNETIYVKINVVDLMQYVILASVSVLQDSKEMIHMMLQKDVQPFHNVVIPRIVATMKFVRFYQIRYIVSALMHVLGPVVGLMPIVSLITITCPVFVTKVFLEIPMIWEVVANNKKVVILLRTVLLDFYAKLTYMVKGPV